ncbi:hypothetical protein DFP72DRAFT_1116577 [Ephemerocybe angulata]|uniref:Uncharacterized protein n=1 Tax=Ephemerocybe angulata TaxID=980116 RepID=A0A8H6I2T5_9AGAR|nr:hypothetical protein DFP72DRAFT_1116577 [Tulosesus angulatus]
MEDVGEAIVGGTVLHVKRIEIGRRAGVSSMGSRGRLRGRSLDHDGIKAACSPAKGDVYRWKTEAQAHRPPAVVQRWSARDGAIPSDVVAAVDQALRIIVGLGVECNPVDGIGRDPELLEARKPKKAEIDYRELFYASGGDMSEMCWKEKHDSVCMESTLKSGRCERLSHVLLPGISKLTASIMATIPAGAPHVRPTETHPQDLQSQSNVIRRIVLLTRVEWSSFDPETSSRIDQPMNTPAPLSLEEILPYQRSALDVPCSSQEV